MSLKVRSGADLVRFLCDVVAGHACPMLRAAAPRVFLFSSVRRRRGFALLIAYFAVPVAVLHSECATSMCFIVVEGSDLRF